MAQAANWHDRCRHKLREVIADGTLHVVYVRPQPGQQVASLVRFEELNIILDKLAEGVVFQPVENPVSDTLTEERVQECDYREHHRQGNEAECRIP